MKRIRLLVNEPLVIGNLTLAFGHPAEVWNKEILESDEVKTLLKQGKIEIIDEENGGGE